MNDSVTDTLRWKIQLFGRLSAQRGEQKVTHFRTEKTGLLLACLVQDPRRSLRRDDLVERLWPNQPEEVGRNRLRVTLASLRSVLEPQPADRGRLLLANRTEVRLQTDRFTTDTMEFEAGLLGAARARDDSERLRCLEMAVALYQENFLPEYDDYWITAERGRLADSYQLALRGLVRLHVNQRRYDKALVVAQRAVAADPYREETHRLVMQVHSLMGRPNAAMRQYKELENLLRRTAESAPSRATRQMAENLTGISPVDSPPRAELPGRRARRPAPLPDSSDRSLVQLPAPVSRLIGCEDSILQVVQMLGTPETRLVNLTGMGGVGKTRLAIAASHHARSLGGSVYYVSLVGISDAYGIINRIATALGLTLRPRNDLWGRVTAALDAADSLLVLDNLEHLLPQAGKIVNRLLEEVSSLTCLTTSRQRLGVAGEYAYVVRPLPTPLPSDNFEQVLSCASVHLWLDRLSAYAPEFQVTPANYRDVATLCHRLDGLPLAIELAAARAASLAPHQIVPRLATRFEFLVSRDEPSAGRHSSLRAALDWSCDLLPVPVRRFFARLSVFRCGWDLDAAEAVCDEPASPEFLAELRERSFITAEQTDAGMRFQLLETVREYAATQLPLEDMEQTNRRFCEYFLRVAEEAEPMLKGPRSPAYLRRLDAEEENLRSALALSLNGPEPGQRALALSVALYRYWYIRGAVHEGRRWLSAALDAAPRNDSNRPKALTALGNLAYGEGDLDAADACYAACKEMHDAAGDPRGVAVSLGNLANVKRVLGDLDESLVLSLECLRIYRMLDDLRGQSLALGNLALISRNLGDDHASYAYSEQALTLFRRMGDCQNLVTALCNMNATALRLGRPEKAADLLLESLDLCLNLGAKRTLAQILSGAAVLCKSRGEYGSAIQLLGAASGLWERLEVTPFVRMRQDLEQHLACMREYLGSVEVEDQWLRGLDLSEDAAILLVRERLVAPAKP